MKTRLLLLVGAFALVLLGGAEISAQTGDCRSTLTDENKGEEVFLHKGERFCLKLKAQLATGFSWRITATDSGKLKLIGERTEKDGADEAAAEFQIFTFEAVGEGAFRLKLAYGRPWEKERPPAKKYCLQIRIEP